MLPIAGLLSWILIPFVIGRLIDANISPEAGNVARPPVLLLMLVWAMYRPSHSRFKMALLQGIEIVLNLGLIVCCASFIIMLITANFGFRALHPLAWLALASAGGLALLKFAMVRWIRFTA